MKHLLAFLAAFALAYFASHALVAQAGTLQTSPSQAHTDVYECCGYPAPQLQTFNPLSKRLVASHGGVVRFRWLVVEGCAAGNMRQTLQAAINDSAFLGVSVVEDPVNYDITIRANCGVGFTNICGAGAAACLGRGFPSTNDIDASTVIASYYDQSQESIWLHELFGHALATWHEQYCLGTETTGICAGQPQFAPAPNGLLDFMNTGPNSRVVWPQLDRDRWGNSMYALAAADPPACTFLGFDPCTGRWRFVDQLGQPTAYDPATGIWYLFEQPEWLPCNADHLRYNLRLGEFANTPGAGTFKPGSYWSFMPAC